MFLRVCGLPCEYLYAAVCHAAYNNNKHKAASRAGHVPSAVCMTGARCACCAAHTAAADQPGGRKTRRPSRLRAGEPPGWAYGQPPRVPRPATASLRSGDGWLDGALNVSWTLELRNPVVSAGGLKLRRARIGPSSASKQLHSAFVAEFNKSFYFVTASQSRSRGA